MINVESYAGGFIIADYRSKYLPNGRYCGKSLNWISQPIIDRNDVFETKEDALRIVKELR